MDRDADDLGRELVRLAALAFAGTMGRAALLEALRALVEPGPAPLRLVSPPGPPGGAEEPRGAVEPEKSAAAWRPAVEAVFDHWRKATGHERARASPERVTKIRARLRDGFTVEQLLSAVNGCAASEFHSTNGHNDLTLICRDASHVEKFLQVAEEKGAQHREVRQATPAEAERERLKTEIAEARKEGRIHDYNRLVRDLRAKGL